MDSKKDTALVVLSGGQDSTICLYWAKQHFNVVRTVSFNYGQKHVIELDCAKNIATAAQVLRHDVIDVRDILRSTSPLLSASAQLETYKDYESMDAIIGDRVELTFVPMRNAFFLTAAANLAISYGCFTLVTGVCQQDNANYPDCRDTFINAQEKTINEALGILNFSITTPLIYKSKAESIHMAAGITGCMEALGESHTCYAGQRPPCGECHACVLRAQGFKEAGIADPLIAATKGK